MSNVTSYNLIGKKSVDELIKSAGTSLTSMRNKVQVASVAILIHAEKCGDYSKAQTLIDMLGNGVNRASLQQFFIVYGGLKFNPELKVFDGWQGKAYIKARFQQAKSQAWWELKQAKDVETEYSLQHDLNKLYKRVQKALKQRETIAANSELSEADKAHKLSLIEVDEVQFEAFNIAVNTRAA